MNKVLHVLVYVFLALAGAGLFFELQLNSKRSLLTDRNKLQEDCLVKIASTIEKEEPAKDTSVSVLKDVSPVEDKPVDSPEMNNVLEEYDGALDQTRNGNDVTFAWGENERQQLRAVYVLDPEGKPVMDGSEPLKRGPGTEQELLDKLLEAAKAQRSRLNTTREALAKLRAKLEEQVKEINEMKPAARQDKMTITQQKQKIADGEKLLEKTQDELRQTRSEKDELNSEIASKNDEIQKKDEEITDLNEKLAKSKELVDNLRKMLQASIQTQGSQSATSAGTAVASLPVGDKGKIIDVDNETMFAVVQFTDEAMKELKGNDLSKPLPVLDLGVKRDGKFVGRIKLRQEVKGKNYVVCDILGSWSQDKVAEDDVVFAD